MFFQFICASAGSFTFRSTPGMCLPSTWRSTSREALPYVVWRLGPWLQARNIDRGSTFDGAAFTSSSHWIFCNVQLVHDYLNTCLWNFKLTCALPIHACSCLLEELLQTYVHKQTKGSRPQTQVITLNSHLRSRLLWAAAMLEQTVQMGHCSWDVTVATVQARCLSCEPHGPVVGGTVPCAAHGTGFSVARFPVQYIDSAVSHGAIIQDKWFTR